MREETRNWIAKADKDLGNAGFALQSSDDPLPVTIALHCQKSAENYLKAFLQEHDYPFSSQHNLSPLLEACISIDASFEAERSDINRLEGYSIASRYPKASDSVEFRNEAIATAQRVKDFVISKLT